MLGSSRTYLRSIINSTKSNIQLFSTEAKNKLVYLDKFHRQTLKGTMTTFAGYSLPVKYKGMMDEQKACRTSAALFDVSHMGPALVSGQQAAKLIQSRMVVDLKRLNVGDAAYSLITNSKFGIIDDAVISKLREDLYYIVFNGSRKEVDKAYFQETAHAAASVRMLDQDNCLLALQGPKAEKTLIQAFPHFQGKITGLKFMQTFCSEINKKRLIITRCGYTGEDGFQILIPNIEAQECFTKLLESGNVQPAGLGARDILRSQAGLCLYGQDIDQDTTPIEAGLLFTISKRRRQQGGFPGYKTFVDQHKNKNFSKKRVGFIMQDQKHLKPGHKILSEKSFQESQSLIVGSVTSGTFSPTLGKGIGMGYVKKQFGKVDTSLYARLSKTKAKRLDIKKMPLIPNNIKK